MKKACISLLLLIFSLSVFSEDRNEQSDPDWLLYRKGIQMLKSRELGMALSLFKKAIDIRKNYPEAEMAIGDIFFIEGEYDLSEIQYKKVYEQKKYLEIPDESYKALYRLVDIYLNRKRYKQTEDTCQAIIKENPAYYNDVYTKYKNIFYNTFVSKGLDRIMVLYRFKERAVVRAHTELARQCYNQGRYEESVTHSLFALNILLSVCIEEYRREDPEYQYKTLNEFIKPGFYYKSIKDYMTDSDIFYKLYYLGCAAYAANHKSKARAVWDVVAKYPQAGKYRILSSKQLKNPWIEDYIDISPNKIEYTIEDQ